MIALATAATRPVSAASGAVFRIGFGVVGVVLVLRFFLNGWIDTLLVDPRFHYHYPGFEWVTAWPAPWMHLHFSIIGVSALAIALGYHYRVAAAVFTLSLAYVELIDRALYLNHYYWMVLTAAIMIALPLHGSHSVDAWRGRAPGSGFQPVWVVWVLRFQVGMVYFFAGLAKVNSDWLLRAEPLSTWLPARTDLWLIGPLLALPATAYLLAWAGALFDLTVVGWLLWRRSRPIAYAVLVTFHAATWLLFPSIGLFPLLMSLSALVFFDPGWPRRRLPDIESSLPVGRGRLRPAWVGLALGYFLLMVAIPLRHHFIPGDVKWTGEGYLGSWQVMLTEKSASADFLVTDRVAGHSWVVPPPGYLTERQRMVMASDPVMIRQTALLIAEDLGGEVEVGADVRVSFNGLMSTRFTDETIVLSGRPATGRIEGFVVARPGP